MMTEPPSFLDLMWCQVHGVISERELEDCPEGHDGTMYGPCGAEDGYTGIIYCGLLAADNDICGIELQSIVTATKLCAGEGHDSSR